MRSSFAVVPLVLLLSLSLSACAPSAEEQETTRLAWADCVKSSTPDDLDTMTPEDAADALAAAAAHCKTFTEQELLEKYLRL